jgi:glycosyltransferase involved in cell wall biosynthesis
VSRIVFVPTLVDRDNHNAQIGNARAVLAEWSVSQWCVAVHAYGIPDQRLVANSRIKITRLWRSRAWKIHLFLRYFKSCDLIFYPGGYPHDLAGLRWRTRLGLSAPVVATLEGLVGNEVREAEYSDLAGHKVFCQHVATDALNRMDEIYRRADHIIAISPFLAQMGESRYGKKFSVLPLGIDSSVFYKAQREVNKRLKVVSAGTVKASKRPEIFVELARRNPQADFVWYGEGELREKLLADVRASGIENLNFPGALSPLKLGAAFRAADIFVMPSTSEGVPKVTQEAAACGLAQVIFGYYQAPSVVDQLNGFVVWSDDDFVEKVGELLGNYALVESMGQAGAKMAIEWNWAAVSQRWRDRLIEVASK